ncbi:MAG: Na(+)/H(+) antiporter subunit D, partial [Parvibaculum sp.]
AFFGANSSLRPKEAPPGMLIAMALTALLCVGIGLYPAALYDLLPYELTYEPYTTAHIITQVQLLAFVALGFALMVKRDLLAPPQRGILLDFDWTYRRLAPAILRLLSHVIGGTWHFGVRLTERRVANLLSGIYRAHGPLGPLARTWPTGSMVLWIAVLLGMTLVLTYI